MGVTGVQPRSGRGAIQSVGLVVGGAVGLGVEVDAHAAVNPATRSASAAIERREPSGDRWVMGLASTREERQAYGRRPPSRAKEPVNDEAERLTVDILE